MMLSVCIGLIRDGEKTHIVAAEDEKRMKYALSAYMERHKIDLMSPVAIKTVPVEN